MKLLTITFVLLSLTAMGQSETVAVMEPINRMFKGMSTGDSAMVHSAFGNRVTLISVAKDKAGKSSLFPEPLQDFLNAVGTPHPESWNEPIWDTKVEVDGLFAQVWAKYAFYLGKKFSHCGVDAFHLYKTSDGQWKIFHLADTRQREGCVVPDAVKEQFK